MRALMLGAVVLTAACEEGYVMPARDPVQSVQPAAPTTIYIETGASSPEAMPPVALATTRETSPEHVHIYPSKDIGRMTEVVGVLDFHTDADSQDKGFEQLKARAAALGADAVIGAEFEHGDPGEKSHLSGMAVRFVDR